ncbi:MAG: DUF6492 family protein [Gemmataceae bacterium]
MQHLIITPSFGPDFERAKLLVKSVNEFVSGPVEHVLLVDRRDVPQFRVLANPRTRIVEAESILPWWVRRVPGARRWWLSLRTLPIRNWILQQVVKLSVAEHFDADVFNFVDSDVAFIRPFDVSSFVNAAGSVRLFRVPGAARLATHARWHQTAARLLGLPSSNYFGANYIGNMVTWRRDHLTALHRHIESVTGRNWAAAVCSRWHLSEYILYGIFVEHILGGRGHYYEDRAHCHISWDYDVSTPEGLKDFIANTRPEHVAIMVSSKSRIPAADYAQSLRALAAPMAC